MFWDFELDVWMCQMKIMKYVMGFFIPWPIS